MRDPNRIEPILAIIREIWYMYPDLRLTQIIMNALGMASDPYYIEDKKLKKDLNALLKIYKKEVEGKH